MINRLVVFGASGDLAGRYLFPALATLQAAGRLTDDFVVIGTAREPWDDETFRAHVQERLETHAAEVPLASRQALMRLLRYKAADTTNAEDLAAVVSLAGGGAVAAYLALPPRLFGATVTALAEVGLAPGSRLALEKPFGESFDDAVALNETLTRTLGALGEQAIYRVDHALGLATVRNLAALRRNDTLLAAVWDAAHIDRIEVRWEEDLALEGRAGYFDGAGMLKDVMQNHMTQVLCLLAMEPPADPNDQDLHDAKAAVLQAIRVPRPDAMSRLTRRARYTAGHLGDRRIPAYADEQGVDPARGTETFAEVVFEVNTPRWHGTPFVLRAGKALRTQRKDVTMRLRPTHPDVEPAFLRIGIDGPEDVTLCLSGMSPLLLTGSPPASDLPAYGRVLLDLLSGGSTLSVRGDEAEAAWKVFDPVIAAWRQDRPVLEEYPAGSDGPPPLLNPDNPASTDVATAAGGHVVGPAADGREEVLDGKAP